MNKQLLPCPFCGGKGEVIDFFIEQSKEMPSHEEIRVKCLNLDCGATVGAHGMFQIATHAQAIKRWNTRHESKPASKAKGTYEEVAEFCKSIGLPESDAEYFFNKCEGCGWTNGKQKIKDWRATIRSWKAAGYMPSTKHPTVPPTRGRAEPVWVQIKRIEEQIDTHPANPSFRSYRADKVTPEQREHYENQKANLKRLKGELI